MNLLIVWQVLCIVNELTLAPVHSHIWQDFRKNICGILGSFMNLVIIWQVLFTVNRLTSSFVHSHICQGFSKYLCDFGEFHEPSDRLTSLLHCKCEKPSLRTQPTSAAALGNTWRGSQKRLCEQHSPRILMTWLLLTPLRVVVGCSARHSTLASVMSWVSRVLTSRLVRIDVVTQPPS